MKRLLLAAVMAAFFVPNAWAQMFPVPLNVACMEDPAPLFEKMKSDGLQEVWRKRHNGGGEMSIYQNLSNGLWVQLGTFGDLTCIIASSPKREVGS